MFAPAVSACRKWIPLQTRALTISVIASEKRVKLRVEPNTGFVAEKLILSVPKKS